MPTPTTLNEALAEIEVLTTQIAYLTEQAAIASAITNKVIPDNSTEITSVATAIINKTIPDYSTVLGNINTNISTAASNLATIADNTTPVTSGTPTAAPAAPVVNTGVV